LELTGQGQVHVLQGEALDDFNKKLLAAINEGIFSLLGQGALHSLDAYLKENYSISQSEWAGHLDLVLGMLEKCLGSVAGRTIGRTIAKRFYWKLGMEFTSIPSYTLSDYVENVKRKISEAETRARN
jgi:hypothetical protein